MSKENEKEKASLTQALLCLGALAIAVPVTISTGKKFITEVKKLWKDI